MKAQIIRVNIKPGERGLFFATSPDLKGLFLSDKSVDVLFEEVPRVIEAVYASKGIKVVVHEAEHDGAGATPWVAVPVHSEVRRSA